MKKTNVLAVALVMAALTIAALFILRGANKKADSVEAPAAVALTVSEAAAVELEWQEIVTATGAISAWREAVIGAEISGQRLIAVSADVGDSVEKGEVLARFNTETLEAEYTELKANWIAAESNQKRALTLRDSGAISDQAIDDYLNQAAVAKARMEAKALQLKYAQIVAPDTGVISARTATLGAVGSAGDELFRLIRQKRLEWRGELTAPQAARVSRGQAVSLTLPNGSTAQGTVRQIAPSFNPDTRMTTVFADIEADTHARTNTDTSAKAGMYAQGEITLGKHSSLGVPAKSVVIRDGHSYVFIIGKKASGTVVNSTIVNSTMVNGATVNMREVKVGRIQGGNVQILAGITKGEYVVLQGAGFLNDGDRVRVLPEMRHSPNSGGEQ